ncbi:putative phosphoesterase [Pseudomonas phage phiK7A1]|uniref:Putative phosphoesterase n=1 Tax=Pseudomonas phage phiK7A1 TaxID=2759194 RepID=A0A7H0XFX0_9CAUD|nr:putative phosphoesterase [Pseudomonas phage phiK7A1]
MIKHAVVADTQNKPDEDLSYMSAIGQYLADKKPDVIVHIGDHWDFPSLSSYDKGKRVMEGRRVVDDIRAGKEGMRLMMAPIIKLQEKQRAAKKKVYSPRLVFTMGNHEARFDRLANDNPELEGLVGTSTLGIEEYGFEVYPFLVPVNIDGIHYVHYLANPMTGKPYGGTAGNILKTVGCSYVMGHRQVMDFAVRPTLDGKMQLGIINGACYPHDEAYKGPQGNTHFRGIMMLSEVKDGFALPMPVSLDYMIERLNK